MMKRNMYVVLIGFTLFLFCVSCSNEAVQDEPNVDADNIATLEDEVSFLATIVEAENGFMVTPIEGEAELKSADLISIATKDIVLLDEEGNDISAADLHVGMTVEIFYDGMIMESYPAQIRNHKVKIVDEALE